MADIIRIEERLAHLARKHVVNAAIGDKAVILLFTGIRYERLDTADGIETPPAKTGKKH